MKLIQIGFLSLLLASTGRLLPAEQTVQVTPEDTVISASIMQPLVENAVALFAKMDSIPEDLSLEISVGTLKPIEKKDVVIAKMTKIRQLIFMLKNNEFLGAQPKDLMRAISLAHALLKLINTALKNNFKDFGSVDIESVFKKSISIDTEVSREEVNAKIACVSKACDLVVTRAKTAGLSWYNHAFRKFDRTVIQPCFKYNIPSYVTVAGLTAAAAFTGWFYGGWKSPEFIRNYTGYPVPDILADHDNPKRRPIHRIGHVFKALTDFARGGLAPLNYIVPPLAVSYGLFAKKINEVVTEKATNLANFLRGGEYRYKKGGVTQWSDTSADFNSIIGCEYQKQQCLPILDYLANAEMHGRKKSYPDKGYLLIGGPGTGKTEFAKALCGEIRKLQSQSPNGNNFKCFSFSASEIHLPLERGGMGGVENMFAFLKYHAPAVAFIDEIHLLGVQSSNPLILSEFLTSMSGYIETDPAKQVIILAATNKPDQIDEALRRKGRFGTTLHFDLPNFENRREYLVRRLSELALDFNLFDVDKLAKETDGCNYEDLNSMVKSAFRKAKIMGTTVNQALLEDSLNDEIRSIIHSPDENISPEEQALIAGYLTGSALTRILLNTADKVSYITLNPVNVKISEKDWAYYLQNNNDKKPLNREAIRYGKVFTYRATDSLKIDSKIALELEIKVLLAGTIAQEMLFNTCTLDYQNEDRKHALELAQKICFNGMEPNRLPKEVQKEKQTLAYNLILKLESEAKELLQENRKALDMLTQMIVENKSLSGEQFIYFVGFADRLAKNQLTPEEKEMMELSKKAYEESQSKTQKESDSVEKEIGLEAVTN